MPPFKVCLISDSMLKHVRTTFAYLNYTDYHEVYSVPGSHITMVQQLAEKHCTDSNLIVINSGINNLLCGYSVSQCMFEYEKVYKAITSCCTSAHVAFASVSYIAENRFDNTDESSIINPLVHELNDELQTYCEHSDKRHFIDLTQSLREDKQYIARSNLACDGLHYSRSGLLRVARVLIGEIGILKYIVDDWPQTLLLSESLDREIEKWPDLPKPAVQATVECAVYPGQQSVNHCVSARKQPVPNKSDKCATFETVVHINRTSKHTKETPNKQYLHTNMTRNFCKTTYRKSKMSVLTKMKNMHRKQHDANNYDIVLSNKFTLLYCDEVHDDDNEHDDNESQCKSNVCSTGLLRKKRISRDTTVEHDSYHDKDFMNLCVLDRDQVATSETVECAQMSTVASTTSTTAKEICTKVHVHLNVTENCDEIKDNDTEHHENEIHCKCNICRSNFFRNNTKCFCHTDIIVSSGQNTSHALNTNNTPKTDSAIFTNPYRHSDFSTLTWTKSCFIQKAHNDKIYCDKNFRRTSFVYDILPKFLNTLNMPVSDPLVYRLLLKYGISVSTRNRPDLTERTTVFNDTDSLIDCIFKMLLNKARPSNQTFNSVIHNTGKYLLKFNSLYGTHFTSCIDKNVLASIPIKQFDINLLLLCGDIESHPGPVEPRKQKQESEKLKTVASEFVSYQNEAQTDHQNTLHLLNLCTSDNQHSVTAVTTRNFRDERVTYINDCYNNKYVIIPMVSNGLCGFYSLSYCLTGNTEMHGDIIDDCITVFTNIEELFRQRTNFGSLRDSSLTLVDYRTFMTDSLERAKDGLSVQNIGWAEDAHFGAISLLYDLAIFIYVVQNKQWYVFNESATRGYICLLSTPGHFDVLLGVDGAPVIPTAAYTQCINRNNFPVSADLWHYLQRNYCFHYVFSFPPNFNGVAIINSPVVLNAYASKEITQTEPDNTAQSKKSVYTCDYPGCNYMSNISRSVALHRKRVHTNKDSGSCESHLNKIPGSKRNNAAQQLRFVTCDYPGCRYVNAKITGLTMHKIRVHHAKQTLSSSRKQSIIATEDNDRDTQSYVITRTRSRCSDTSSYVHSVTSCNTRTSEQREGITRKRFLSDHDNQQPVKRYKRYHISTGSNCSHIDSEVNSITSMRTRSSTLSSRSTQRRALVNLETIEVRDTKKAEFMCDIIGCGLIFNSKNGLSIHKGKSHKVKVQANSTSNENSIVLDHRNTIDGIIQPTAQTVSGVGNLPSQVHAQETCSVNTRSSQRLKKRPQRFSLTTMKQHIKDTFSSKINYAKKQLLPKSKPIKQKDPLYDKLKQYHDYLLKSVTNTTTEKLSSEVLVVLINPSVIDDNKRQFCWSKADEQRLNELNRTTKLLEPRYDWTWGAADDTEQGQYNDKRMQLCVTTECQWKLIECQECGSTGLLVGDQTDSSICYDCMKIDRVNVNERKKKQEAWNKVRPVSRDYPKNVDGNDLPYLQPGDKAVIAPVHPVVTITKNSYADKRLRMESISLIQDPIPTWCKILPRTSLTNRFMIIERRVQNSEKYVVANPDRVLKWLRYLFVHHKEFTRLRRQNLLVFDEAAIENLGPDLELAEVDNGLAEQTSSQTQYMECESEHKDDGLTDATVSSGLSQTHVFSFDRYPELYLKTKDIMRIKKEGKIQIIKDDTIRKPTYCTSANLAFPYLYPHCEMSPLDFGDYKLGRYLLKKQALFAHRMGDGRLQFHFAEDDVHMAHQYSRLSEQTVRANVGYYLSSHPSVAHVPLNNIISAFRDGVDQDCGLLDSHLPDLTVVMSQLPNSRAKWFTERLGIEAISRDLGSPNLFVTINLDLRASPDVRRLIYKLQHGKDMERDEPFMKDTAEFTRLTSKYAGHLSIYLYRKVKIIMHTFFTEICGIREIRRKGDWREQDTTETGWFWGRVEFTETRGFPHFHYLVKLPHVLDTGLLGRMIHNARIVRTEMKCGNIKPDKQQEAWQIIEIGLLASRYAALFAHSISMSSFYTEEVAIDDHDDDKVIRLEDYRSEYAKNYKDGNINLHTHPIMRRFDDPECDSNHFQEMAHVASVSCLHQCIPNSCGGDRLTGDGCRFDFPKKPMKHTVAAVMQVNANQMEARILLRRTCDRVANLNRYFIRYLRSNHDVSVLIDSAHKLRYATKYCAKSGKHTQLLDEVIEHLNKRSTEFLPYNMKQTLSHLLLADCSHRAFISKQELAYKVMQLPDIMKSFANVDIVGFYNRANFQVPYDDEYTIEYSDRTEYSAYAERCRDDTELGRGLTKEAIENMTFNEFAQTVQHKWINSKKEQSNVVDESTKRKFRTRNVNTGHWHLTLCTTRKHTRPSTVLYTAPAIDYELVDHGKTTTQTTFFDLAIEKRHQLYRSYYELVMYVPWKNTPDDTFLSDDVISVLQESDTHPEIDCRHSLQRLEEFFQIYQKFYYDGKVAPPGSAWHKDNQFSYSMYLVNQHNRDMHLDRVDNKGMLKAQYEDVDELVNVDVDIRPAINDVSDLSEYPTFENFMPPDIFRNIMEQRTPELCEICVAFPLQHQWQRLEDLATHDKIKRFIANPPQSSVSYENMTPIQQFAVQTGIDRKQQILFLCGKAGSGKTAVALNICEHFAGKVQATAYTGKAASLFNGPTIHSMFGWSHNEHRSASVEIKPDSKKVEQFRVAHEGIELFVIEEALYVPPAYFALMDEMMTAAFNPKGLLNYHRQPFGGKKMLFLGDQSQLPPIGGPAVYDEGLEASSSQSRKRESKQSQRTKKGQLIFEKYLVPNCIYFQKGQRNCGMLGEICDRMRHGKLTEEDCTMLTYQRTRFPDVCTEYGIHYQNDMCAMHNWRQLWNECVLSEPQRRFYICHATYHKTGNNDDCVDALRGLPPQSYEYAPDILCVAEGCEVRLLQNVNTAAGLVTSQCGTVVRVIYNNSDTSLLLAGEHVVPYCIIVSFSSFRGFIQNANDANTRIFPFPNQRTWVPVFRRRFSGNIRTLPKWVRKKQLEKDCYRIQFPLDLANNITAHRAQGQTMANCLVSVDIGLENPDNRMPPEISSILYVACSRVTKLENLFVNAIHPSVWKKIGQNEVDQYRRTVDEKLQKASKEFASNHGMYSEMVGELAWTPDYTRNAEEWRLLQQQSQPPKTKRLLERCPLLRTSSDDFLVDLGNIQFSMFSTPVLSERHIGIDQGFKNFAIAVVERTIGENPNVVQVKNYTNLNLSKNFDTYDVVDALNEHTDLMSWMNPVNASHNVDRVIVHLEQINPRNRYSKAFAAQLGKLLQQQATNVDTCIVKMSQPHIHRATGPLFHLGEEIVETLQLQPALYSARRSTAETNPSVTFTIPDSNLSENSDVEPDVVEPSDDTVDKNTSKSKSQEYRAKKKISADVFRYIIEADADQTKQMKLTVQEDMQTYWRAQITFNPKVKLDDAGDALLHALDELLCGSTNFKQLVPASPSVHVNRTVAIAVFPDTTYWIVLNCRWNTFVLENFGSYSSGLRNCYYKSNSTVDAIKRNTLSDADIRSALWHFQSSEIYDTVDHIKVVVKQLTGHTELKLTNVEAGALTDSTTKAMKLICDGVIGRNSKLCNRHDKILGSMYVRTSTLHSDRKYQVVNSTGKHTNAVLSCLSWMKQHLRDFVENRRQFVSENEKKIFFNALLKVAQSNESSIDMLQLSDTAKTKLTSKQMDSLMQHDKTLSRNIADLVLIAISKNQQHVKAIAANSRQKDRLTNPLFAVEQDSDVEP